MIISFENYITEKYSLDNKEYFLFHKSKNGNKLKIALINKDKSDDDGIVGYIYLNQYTPKHWEVLSVAADKGYGYVMHDASMDFIYDDYIIPARNKEIKKDLLNVYKKYKDRNDVIVENINEDDNNYIPIDNYNDLFNIKIKLKNKLNYKFIKDEDNFLIKNGIKFFNKKYIFDNKNYKL